MSARYGVTLIALTNSEPCRKRSKSSTMRSLSGPTSNLLLCAHEQAWTLLYAASTLLSAACWCSGGLILCRACVPSYVLQCTCVCTHRTPNIDILFSICMQLSVVRLVLKISHFTTRSKSFGGARYRRRRRRAPGRRDSDSLT